MCRTALHADLMCACPPLTHVLPPAHPPRPQEAVQLLGSTNLPFRPAMELIRRQLAKLGVLCFTASGQADSGVRAVLDGLDAAGLRGCATATDSDLLLLCGSLAFVDLYGDLVSNSSLERMAERLGWDGEAMLRTAIVAALAGCDYTPPGARVRNCGSTTAFKVRIGGGYGGCYRCLLLHRGRSSVPAQLVLGAMAAHAACWRNHARRQRWPLLATDMQISTRGTIC